MNPYIQELEALVGEWDTEATHRMLPSTVVRGHSAFEWLEGEKFLIVRSRVEHPDFPDSISVIGDTEGLCMHYFDSRGVARTYQMSLARSEWKLLRDRPDLSPLDFSQRFSGTLSSDGNTITGLWEMSKDGATWENDLWITYRRTS